MKQIHGRRGKADEYYEFMHGDKSLGLPTFIAQRVGTSETWHVYEHTENGPIKVLPAKETKWQAVAAAERFAFDAYED